MNLVNKFAVALLLLSLAGTAALGKTRSKQVEFEKAVKVNGTVVKAGSYKVAFDEMANELSISKNGKLVVKTTAHLMQRETKVRGTQVHYRADADELQLVGLSFGGDQEIVVGQSGMQATGNN